MNEQAVPRGPLILGNASKGKANVTKTGRTGTDQIMQQWHADAAAVLMDVDRVTNEKKVTSWLNWWLQL